MQNATFDENPHDNERISLILGYAINFISHTKHRCMGGWIILWIAKTQTNISDTHVVYVSIFWAYIT